MSSSTPAPPHLTPASDAPRFSAHPPPVVGVDFGSSNCKIGKAIRGGVNVILNESSERLTACVATASARVLARKVRPLTRSPSPAPPSPFSALVSFKDNERYLGSAASSMTRTNMANTITHIKRFIGRKFSEAGVQEDLKDVNFRAVAMDNDEIGVKVRHTSRGAGRRGGEALARSLERGQQCVGGSG